MAWGALGHAAGEAPCRGTRPCFLPAALRCPRTTHCICGTALTLFSLPPATLPAFYILATSSLSVSPIPTF